MPLIVKPISAILTTDKDTFGKSVMFLFYTRTPIVLFLLETKNKGQEHVVEEEKIQHGLILLILNNKQINLKFKFGMTILSVMI